jgi:hypothetical protein
MAIEQTNHAQRDHQTVLEFRLAPRHRDGYNWNTMAESAVQKTILSPKVYRAMLRDEVDGLPVAGANANALGVRVPNLDAAEATMTTVDVRMDELGNVAMDGGGMSVAPEWRKLPVHRIPERLRPLVPSARGKNMTACYAMGEGEFVRGAVAVRLELIPDKPGHGVIAPTEVVPIATYQSDLGATRRFWRIDES